ncbi:MAG TPA: alpha-L-arabinofuranosidase C-terminal domain-containing protein, partial [Candidatus Acidoferrum sp.]|nr:alpha-L-arabinofuranosidase C-terminal domain-containing protein [Candidatus Acidoferrum sp.]
WPGGCFADEYHWMDGIGPPAQRKKTVNTTWGGVIDDNAFGTHEFMAFAELIGADVYINGNLGTGTPAEMAQWLEYMTSDSQSTLANLRRQNGRDQPWKIQYFALGNESWGCGGSMTPAYYTDLYKHFGSFLKTPADNKPELIASGGHTNLTEWTDYLIQHVGKDVRLNGIGHHYYTLPSGSWDTNKGPALGFDETAWFNTLKQTRRIEGFIQSNVAILDKYDPAKKTGFYVDEWGTWYDTEQGDNPGFLYQQNSLRDAIVAALNFNIFHQYADRVRMANIAQMVNVLQAMILTDKQKMLLTPTYHAFSLYVPFQDAMRLPVTTDNMPTYDNGKDTMPKLSVTAARGKNGKLYLALVNVDPRRGETVVIAGGSGFKRANGRLLTADAMDAHNTFEHPDAVAPEGFQALGSGGKITLDVPAKAVLVLELE